MRLILAGLALVLAGCTVSTAPAPAPRPQPSAEPQQSQRVSRNAAVQRLSAVVDRVEPVAERECRRRTRGVNCDLSIYVDERETEVVNAFQTLDRQGNPIIVFTLGLAQEARNDDELAFVLGHEAAHHIEGHIPQTQQTAVLGAVLGGVLAQAGGAPADVITAAQDIGATVGARSFSKEFELEADRLGTIIAAQAGYDPVRGAEFFNRIPDPGNRFLGTHPPNAERIRVVRETAAGL